MDALIAALARNVARRSSIDVDDAAQELRLTAVRYRHYDVGLLRSRLRLDARKLICRDAARTKTVQLSVLGSSAGIMDVEDPSGDARHLDDMTVAPDLSDSEMRIVEAMIVYDGDRRAAAHAIGMSQRGLLRVLKKMQKT